MSSNLSILVVEDDNAQRRQMIRILRVNDRVVSEASTGEEAITALKEREIDLVLTDRRMPGIGGDSLFAHIRDNYPWIQVAMVTAYPEGAKELKPDGILEKPFKRDQLIELIRNLTGEGNE